MAQEGQKKSDLILISCSKTKQSVPCSAKEMYFPSTFFKKMWMYAETLSGNIKILSARYGLIDPKSRIVPYNETLTNKNQSERRIWTRNVFAQLKNQGLLQNFRKIIFLCGKTYSEELKKYLLKSRIDFEDPMKGLGIGERLAWVNQRLKNRNNPKLTQFF